jgi:hypothetical protein
MISPASTPKTLKPTTGVNEGFHEDSGFGKRSGSLYRAERDFRQAIRHATLVGLRFIQTDPSKLGVREQAERHFPSGGNAMTAQDIVVDDVEVIFGDVREVRAPGALAHCPDIGRGGFQALIHFDIPTVGGFDASEVQANTVGVGRATRRDQKIGAFQDQFRAVAAGA